MMTLDELLKLGQPLTPSHIRAISEAVLEISHEEKMDLDEVGVLAAATGLLRGLAKMIERRDAPPAAAGQPDPLTSLDV